MLILDDLRRDTGIALRSFRREPAFAAGVVLTFALAIGANATMFELVRRLMFAAPPHIENPGRVGRVLLTFSDGEREPYSVSSTSWPVFRAVSSLEGVVAGAAAMRHDTLTTGRGADRAEVAVAQVTGDYFTVLGTRPALGRFFGPDEDVLPEGSAVVVLSHAYWRRAFAGARDVLGRDIVLADQPFTIIGVAPREFNGTELSSVDLFVPFTAAQRGRAAGWWNEPGLRLLTIVARLRDGVTTEHAGAATAAALRDDGNARSEGLIGATIESLDPGPGARQSTQGRVALWLSGVSLVVLLVAIANAGTLMLLRAARRRRELSVRVALGASRARIARQFVVESVVLAGAGGLVGLLVARWLGDLVRAVLVPNMAPTERLLDGTLFAASIATALVAGLTAGVVPFGQLGRRDLTSGLRDGDGHGASSRFAVQRVLVAVQVALCTVLLIGAGAFVLSLERIQSQDLGFSTARLLHITLDFQERPPAHERDRAHEEAALRLASMPGVTAATIVQGMPFSSHHIPPISVPGVDVFSFGSGQPPIMYGATPAYLAMMNVTPVAGRLFTERDDRASAPVVLINESMARNLWPGESALGKCVRAGHPPGFDPDGFTDLAAALPCREVVGVVRDSRARSLRAVRDEAALMQYYVPFPQLPHPPFPDVADVHGLLVQTTGDAREHAADVQRAIQSASATPVYARVRPYQDLIDPQLRTWRLGATLFSAFGLLAVGIAALGLFAVISYLVTQRRREIGVRLALGGQPMSVGRRVVGDAVRMAGLGAVAGVAIAMIAAPLVQSLLYETSAREPALAITAMSVLILVAVVAAVAPAMRATRVSPMEALRIQG